jgi:hypothetical protein
MIEVIQNAIVDRPRPGWNRMATGLRLDFSVRAGAPLRARRNDADSGRYRSISGTRTRAGSAPMMNIHAQPKRSITKIPRSAVVTAPTW